MSGLVRIRFARRAQRRALLARRVAVVDRRSRAFDGRARAVTAPGPGRAPSPGRGRAPAPCVTSRAVERRELEAQRLAGRRAGGDDRSALPAGVQRIGLVAHRKSMPRRAQRGQRPRDAARRERDEPRLARVLGRLADEPLVGPAGIEQRVPRLDVAN